MPSTLAAWVRFPPRQASVSQMSPHSTAAIVWPTSFRTRSISSAERPAERRKSFATGGAFWRRTSGITASRKDRASSLKPSNRDAAPLPKHQRAPDVVNKILKWPGGQRRVEDMAAAPAVLAPSQLTTQRGASLHSMDLIFFGFPLLRNLTRASIGERRQIPRTTRQERP
jgi:hypothetical protein